jgi:hypothetical protein
MDKIPIKDATSSKTPFKIKSGKKEIPSGQKEGQPCRL